MPPSASQRRRAAVLEKLNLHAPGHPATEGHSHAVDHDEKRAVKCAAGRERDRVPRMDAELIQALLHPAPTLERNDAASVSWRKLVEPHGTRMITILILNSTRTASPFGRRRRGAYPRGSMTDERLRDLFERLLAAYGPQGWWPGGRAPFEVIVGAILTQRCSWKNAARAIENLRTEQMLSPNAVCDAPVGRIAVCIRPAVFYNAKAKKLRAFAEHVRDGWRGDLDAFLDRPPETLRRDLLTIHGIGEETADAILLYAAGKPSFVIDAYARRLLERLGWIDGRASYATLRRLFMEQLPLDAALFNEYHALIVQHGKTRCRPRPVCGDGSDRCPLADLCLAIGSGERAAGVRSGGRVG